MSKAVELHLLSLVPGIALPIPPKLVNLSVSLLAQSRSKASSLKPEEESARGYVCAHIACERLKQSLDLPKIAPRPSLPPRPYKKLYDYIDSVLTPRAANQNESAPSTPRKPRPATAHTTPGNNTPKGTPKGTPSKTRTPQPPSIKRRRTQDASSAADIPSWVTPAIRSVCKALKAPNATPHVYVGVSSILTLLSTQSADAAAQPPRKRRKSADQAPDNIAFDAETQVPALIAMVTIHVINALSADSPTPSEYALLRSRIVKALLRCIPDDMVATEEDVVADIERFLRAADAGGWLQMEWYVNLENQARGNEVDEQQGDESEKNGRGGDGDVSGVAVQRRAFGGMMTPQTDYLSEENVLEYREWREYVEGLMQ